MPPEEPATAAAAYMANAAADRRRSPQKGKASSGSIGVDGGDDEGGAADEALEALQKPTMTLREFWCFCRATGILSPWLNIARIDMVLARDTVEGAQTRVAKGAATHTPAGALGACMYPKQRLLLRCPRSQIVRRARTTRSAPSRSPSSSRLSCGSHSSDR